MTEGWQWKHQFVHRKASLVTTWRFRLAILVCCGVVVSLTRGVWIPGLGRSLVCNEQIAPVDAILVDNLDENYLLFERAAELRNAGFGRRVLVPVFASSDLRTPNMVSEGIARVMARVASLQEFEMIPIVEVEPITLNAAYQIRKYLAGQNVQSIGVVTAAFRSRRSLLVYESVLGQPNVAVSCVPVFGRKTSATWVDTWHGVVEVGEQLVKLQYYRFYVLPFVAERGSSSS